MFYSPEALLLIHHHDQAKLYEDMLSPARPVRSPRPGMLRRAWSAARSLDSLRRPIEPIDCTDPCTA